jgi:predicted RNA-binding protein YlxR (DUF448 family)
VVYTPEERIEVDVTGKRNGRGAYLCRKQSCWGQAIKTGSLSRALRVSLSHKDHEVLRVFAETLPDADMQS